MMIFRLRIAFVGALYLGLVGSAFAQAQIQAPGQLGQGVTPDLQSMFQRPLQFQQAGQPLGAALEPSVQIYQPVLPETRPPVPASALEQIIFARTGSNLRQFGYDILGVPTAVSAAQLGGTQENYILGVGDTIVVALRGQENVTYQERVNREGQIVLPKLRPLQAAGRSFGEFRDDVEREVAQTYISTNAFTSLGAVREVSVLVTGEVRSPGTRIVTALATPLDALLLSGGVAKTGSLRNVTLIRGNQTRTIDLYQILTQGNLTTLGTVQNGDRIFVPTIQNTVSIAGRVRRNGIYELRPGETSIDSDQLIALAGGYEIPGAYRLSKLQTEPDGSLRLVSFTGGGRIANGDILFVDPAVDIRSETVSLRGAVRLPNYYPLSTATSVRQLIRNVNDILPEAYTAFALIVRRDLVLNVKTLIPFSLSRVLSSQQDIPLRNEDVVYIFSRNEARSLANSLETAELASATQGYSTPTTPNTSGTQSNTGAGAPAGLGIPGAIPGTTLSLGGAFGSGFGTLGPFGTISPGFAGAAGFPGAAFGGPNQSQAPAGPTTTSAAIGEAATTIRREADPGEGSPGATGSVAGSLGVSSELLTAMVSENLVWLLDEIKEPGAYIVASGTSLGEMVEIAGGPLRTADLTAVEVTSTAIDATSGTSRTVRTGYKGSVADLRRVNLLPLDVVRFRPIFSDRERGRITISGQVRYPGTFEITRGETLSAVLERAGGLTSESYPYGAVFTRKSAAVAESEGNLKQARELQSQLATAIQGGVSLFQAPEAASASIAVVSSLIQELRTMPTLGRIVVTADPAILTVKPELDIIMEEGDTLFIPKRPSTVTVAGEVLNQGSFQYITGLEVGDYVNLAGGTTQGADNGRTFIVLPDGSARPARTNYVSFSSSALLPPGSTVVVPRDVAPLNLNQLIRDVSQIASQIAITAASLIVIGRY